MGLITVDKLQMGVFYSDVGDLLIITGKWGEFNKNKFGCIDKIPHRLIFERILVEMFEK